jgi:hypothetical protein
MKPTYTDAKEAVAIVQAAFPDYHHSSSRLTVEPFTPPITPTSYWSGGSRDYWSFVRITDLKASSTLPEAGSGFVQDAKPIEALPEGFALVRYTIGSYRSACVYLHAANLTPLLPPSIELTQDEEIVLACTAGLKSFARREHAAKLWGSWTFQPDHHGKKWDAAVASLKVKGLVQTNGAATTAGRNRAVRLSSIKSSNPELKYAC